MKSFDEIYLNVLRENDFYKPTGIDINSDVMDDYEKNLNKFYRGSIVTNLFHRDLFNSDEVEYNINYYTKKIAVSEKALKMYYLRQKECNNDVNCLDNIKVGIKSMLSIHKHDLENLYNWQNKRKKMHGYLNT